MRTCIVCSVCIFFFCIEYVSVLSFLAVQSQFSLVYCFCAILTVIYTTHVSL